MPDAEVTSHEMVYPTQERSRFSDYVNQTAVYNEHNKCVRLITENSNKNESSLAILEDVLTD